MLPPPPIENRINRNPATTKKADLELTLGEDFSTSSGAVGILVYPPTDYVGALVEAAV